MTSNPKTTTGLNNAAVRKIAQLARLYDNMSDELVEEYRGELAGILNLADELQNIDTKDIDYLDGARTMGLADLREDIPTLELEQVAVDEQRGEVVSDYAVVRQNIINNFPNSQNNLLVIQGIFESD
jgi:aspartyl/glutamyl-tRNA(Asn/Gln) amidotransferase C subunit